MKKLVATIAIAATLMMVSIPSMAQVFIMEEDELNNTRNTVTQEEFGVMVPGQDLEEDQWKHAPLGEGIVMLAGLAGAYLIGKRRKEEERLN